MNSWRSQRIQPSAAMDVSSDAAAGSQARLARLGLFMYRGKHTTECKNEEQASQGAGTGVQGHSDVSGAWQP
ncbi:MAG: hypothetical protein WCH75_31620, partial [Candidatus Binatia bacterium]